MVDADRSAIGSGADWRLSRGSTVGRHRLGRTRSLAEPPYRRSAPATW